MSHWLKKADFPPMPSGAPGKPPFPAKSPSPFPPKSPAGPALPGGPKTEKEDVVTAEKVLKDLTALEKRESAEGEPKQVKLLTDAKKLVETYLKAEKAEVKDEEKSEKKEEPKKNPFEKKEPKEEKKEEEAE